MRFTTFADDEVTENDKEKTNDNWDWMTIDNVAKNDKFQRKNELKYNNTMCSDNEANAKNKSKDDVRELWKTQVIGVLFSIFYHLYK